MFKDTLGRKARLLGLLPQININKMKQLVQVAPVTSPRSHTDISGQPAQDVLSAGCSVYQEAHSENQRGRRGTPQKPEVRRPCRNLSSPPPTPPEA
jgi:hypothetical protein